MHTTLDGSLARLISLCSNLDEATAASKPDPSRWSIAEIIEHLAIVERRVALVLLKNLSGPPADPEVLLGTIPKSDWIRQRVSVRLKPIQAPAEIEPSGGLGPWPTPLKVFEAARQKVIGLASNSDDRFDSRTFPHPFLGPLTLRQWCHFAAAHAWRHSLQIEDLLTGK